MFVSKKDLTDLEKRIGSQASALNILRTEKEILDNQVKDISNKASGLVDKNMVLEKRIYDLAETVKSYDGRVSAVIDGLINKVNSLAGLLDHRVIEFNGVLTKLQHEKEISDKQVELLTKIVCHLSGAKAYDGKRDFSFDEISRRLAKLEGREDGNG